jgi:hypothetical protein
MEYVILIYLHHIFRQYNFLLPVLFIPEEKKVILNKHLALIRGRKRIVSIERKFLEAPELIEESDIILGTGDLDVVGLILQFLSEKHVQGGELDYSVHYIREIKKKGVD